MILGSVIHTYVWYAALGDHHTLAEVLKLLLLVQLIHVGAFRELYVVIGTPFYFSGDVLLHSGCTLVLNSPSMETGAWTIFKRQNSMHKLMFVQRKLWKPV